MNRYGLFLFFVAVALVAVWMPEIAWASPSPTDPCAGHLFCLPPDDQSITWLKATFPELVNIGPQLNPGDPGYVAPTPGPSTILADALMVINSGVLAVGSLLLTYKLFAGIVQTANDGEVLGKRWSTLWGPVRVAASAALIVPTASGYCLAQAAVIAVTLLGVGLANSVWNRVVDGLLEGKGLISPQPHANHERIARAVFKNNLCIHLANYHFIQRTSESARGGSVESLGSIDPDTIGATYDGWAWAGGSNPYAGGGSPDFGTEVFRESQGSLFYRDASWVRHGGGVNPDVTSATLSWTNATPSSAWVTILRWFGWDFSKDACGKVRITGIDFGEGPAMTLEEWRGDGDSDVAQFRQASQRISEQVSGTYGQALMQLAIDLDEPAQRLASRIINYYMANAHRDTIDNPEAMGITDDLIARNGEDIFTAARTFGSTVRSQIEGDITTLFGSGTDIMDQYKAAAKAGGWLVAGEWYLNIMKINAIVHRLINNTVEVPDGGAPNFAHVCTIMTECGSWRERRMLRRALGEIENHYDDAIILYNISQRSGMSPDETRAWAGQVARVTGAFSNAGDPDEEEHNTGPMMRLASFLRVAFVGFANGNVGNVIGAAVAQGMDIADINQVVDTNAAAATRNLLEGGGVALNTNATNPIATVISLGRTLWQYGLVLYFTLDSNGYSNADRAQIAVFTNGSMGDAEVVAGLATEANGISSSMGQVLKAVGQIMLIPGFLLGYLFPFLPWLLWIGGVVGWFILVLEAVIAAPLWALAHMRMDGEGIMGPAGQQGYMLALSLMLRPALMIIGMVCGMVLITIMVPYAGTSMVATFELGRTSGARPDMMGQVVMIALLAFVTVTIAYKAFGLIHQIPDRVLRWIGSGSGGAGEDEFRTGAMAIVNTGALTGAVSAASGDSGGGLPGGGGGGGEPGGSGSISSRSDRNNQSISGMILGNDR